MGDPMDLPPTDHGSDRYGYVEFEWPDGMERPPLPVWLVEGYEPCLDCNANLFLTWHVEGGHWHTVTAHDDGCPTYLALTVGP